MLIYLSLFKPFRSSLQPGRAGLSEKVVFRGHLPPKQGSLNGGAPSLPEVPDLHRLSPTASPMFSLAGPEPVILVSDMAAIQALRPSLVAGTAEGPGVKCPVHTPPGSCLWMWSLDVVLPECSCDTGSGTLEELVIWQVEGQPLMW